MIMLRNIIYIGIVCLLFSCTKEYENNCFDQQGEIKTEIRELEPFTSLQVYDVFNIYLKQDTICYIEIEASENYIPYITSGINNGSLCLYNNIECRWSREYTGINITVHFVNLTFIKNHETCLIESLDTIRGNKINFYVRAPLAEMNLVFNCNHLEFSTSYTTAGKYVLRGKTGLLQMGIHNSSVIDAQDMIAQNAKIFQNSIGDMKVNVINTLDAEIWSKGNILVYNQPGEVVLLKEGKGNLIYK